MAVSGLAGRRSCASPPHCRSQQSKAGRRSFSVTNQPPLQQSRPSAGRKPDSETPPGGRRKRATTPSSRFLAAAVVVGTLCCVCYSLGSRSAGQTDRGLNGESFAPFVVVAREPVSATAVVLTLRPAPGVSPAAREVTRTAIAKAWRRRGTWAVEAKQPQLQIAREYTPLPPASGDGDDDDGDDNGTTIRLFVRLVPGGEMSKYLVQRTVGETVSLRGPRTGFAVAQRLDSDGGRVVFLAAGTGIAPALQAADAVLRTAEEGDSSSSSSSSSSTPTTSVTILWANRRLQDGEGYDDEEEDGTAANPIVRDLQAMQRRHGRDRLQVRCFADEDRSFITEAVVRASLDRPGCGGTTRSWWWWPWWPWWPWQRQRQQRQQQQQQQQQQQGQETAAGGTQTTLVPATDCGGCSCDLSARGQRNLLMISGPDGFVSSWAGPKSWAGGQERQGPVGGVLGTWKRRYADVLESWLVLKL